ncbi:uncharacterized protein cep295 isoform 2-T2 [Pholidichthys leucotaenia]
MRRKVSRLRPSPNEEARIIREEQERRRRLRIQQVREQQRSIALQIRREVEQRRQYEIQKLEEELRRDWQQQQREKLQMLQRLYQESLQLLGEGHRNAKENEPDLAAMAQREEENNARAEERYREALKELKSQKLRDNERQNQLISARKKALQAEKERSARVASLPLPPPDPIQNISPKKPHVVRRSDVSAFAVTHYHLPESAVDREEHTDQPDAREKAELEVRRLQELQEEEQRRREEQKEKAHLRGRQALRREQLVQDRERLLAELEYMQQTDLLRRRRQVSQMPPQIFQPLYKRQEAREDFQREMEFAFEDMYTGERRIKGDLVVQLAPEPLPALSTNSQDQELDVSLVDYATAETGTTPQSTEEDTPAEVEPSKPAPRQTLKKLLDRIRTQRDQWTQSSTASTVVSPAGSATVIRDQIPERDTTIETGSLTSEDKRTPVQLRDSTPSLPPASETTAPSNAAEPQRPDVLTSRIQVCEEERRKREEDLEREKQQQVSLLQELEEQKARLEQMLLEAQQEREQLKAAVSQEVPVSQSEVSVHEREEPTVSRGLSSQLEPPTGEADHTRRIREYRQRLLEQNRVHQRSVEVARQRLEEYQRALRIRHDMTTTWPLPPVVPPSRLHPPEPARLAAPLLHPRTPAAPSYARDKPQTSVEVNREADALASLRLLQASGQSVPSTSAPADSVSETPGVTARLTDRIMERVTEHLPERLRPPSVTRELPAASRHSTGIPLQKHPDPIQAVRPNISGVTPLERRQTGLQQGPEPDFTPLGLGRAMMEPQSSLISQRDDTERQRRELQEAERRAMAQREAAELQRRRRDVLLEQMRRQKETLQALIQTEAPPPVSESVSEASASENINQSRLRLLASLLRAIEESNGGTLSHLEDPGEDEVSQQQPPSQRVAPSVPAGPTPVSDRSSGHLHHHHHRAPKPPVARVKLGFIGMTEQHELSAIQEVETPADDSQLTAPENSATVPTHAAHRDLLEESDPSVSSDETLQTSSVSDSGLRAAKRAGGSGSSSDRSSGLVWRERLSTGVGTSPDSPDSGSFLRRFSSLSSNSGRGADFSNHQVTSHRSPITESSHRPPESDCLSSITISTGSYVTTDPNQNGNTASSEKSSLLSPRTDEGGAADVASSQGIGIDESSTSASPGPSVDSFNDSNIQRIINKYTKELNVSLSSARKTADGERSSVEEPGSSVSQPSLVQVSERRRQDEDAAGRPSLLSDAVAAQTTGPESDRMAHLTLECFSRPDLSLYEDPDHNSFQPLIGQPADQSSCLSVDHRDSALEQLVGHPSAHSSMIGHPPGLWDSMLGRMIGQLFHQSSSHWLSSGQDFYAGQLMSQMAPEPSSTWLDEIPDQSRMRPLVGELDESAGQHGRSSGERIRVDVGISTENGDPSYLTAPPQESAHSGGSNPLEHAQQDQIHLDSERVEDSFHPLTAEFTHNDTAEPSMIFHLPENGAPGSPDRRPNSSISAPLTESEDSPEFLRAEQWNRCTMPSQESFSRLMTSESHPQESVLIMSSPAKTDVDLTPAMLSGLSVSNDKCALRAPQSEESQGPDQTDTPPALEEVKEKGILEQSEITLVSATDTIVEDQNTMTEEEECEEKESEFTLVPEDDGQTKPVMALEFHWGLSSGLQEVHQQKLAALLQKSNKRMQEMKSRAVKTQPVNEAEPESSKAKPKTGAQQRDGRTKGGQMEMRRQPSPPPVSDCRLKKAEEVKICTQEQRKQNISEMHQRTRRLYEQLEEVKQQRAVRSRREDYAKNRLKAKEFHQKTLQKLRAKHSGS